MWILLFSEVTLFKYNVPALLWPIDSSEQVKFRDLLMRLRTGDCNQDDWNLLLTRQPSQVKNITDFKGAIRLYYSNDDVANYNFQSLSELQQPIARINVIHSSLAAKKISSEDMSGLEPVIFLAKGAHVMLTMNLWTDKSQGLTLSNAWIDIGKTEKTAGISYVAISRVKTLSSCVIDPMTFERLASLKMSKHLKFRDKEGKRLDELAKQTYHKRI